MMKEIKTLSEKEFAAFVKSYYKALEPLGELDVDIPIGFVDSNPLVVSVSTPLIKTFAATIGIPKVPMLLASVTVTRGSWTTLENPPREVPFERPIYGGLTDSHIIAYAPKPNPHEDLMWKILEGTDSEAIGYKKITVWDLEADGSLTPNAAKSLRKAGEKELKRLKRWTESDIRETYIYEIAKSVSGIKLKKVRNYVVQGSQEEKLMALLQSGKQNFFTQAVELCIALGKLDFLSHVIENVLHLNPIAFSQLGKM